MQMIFYLHVHVFYLRNIYQIQCSRLVRILDRCALSMPVYGI